MGMADWSRSWLALKRNTVIGTAGQEARQGDLLDQNTWLSVRPGMAGFTFEERLANHDDLS